MDLNESREGPITVIAVAGRLDSASASVLDARLASVLAPPAGRLLIELSDLEYISSAGFRVLLVAARRARETEGRVVLSGVAGQVGQLFEVGGFLKLFRIFGTRDEALDALR